MDIQARRVTLPVLVLALLTAPVAVRAEAADPVAAIVRYNAGTLAVLRARQGMAARVERFEVLVRDHYDMPAIAALVVGPRWAATPAAERSAAVAALARHSAVQLASNFVSFGGERFTVDPVAVSRGSSRVVRVTISSGSGSDTLLYRMRQNGAQWRIVDVIAEGVSQLAVQRSEFAATVASGGVAALTARLIKADAAALAAARGRG